MSHTILLGNIATLQNISHDYKQFSFISGKEIIMISHTSRKTLYKNLNKLDPSSDIVANRFISSCVFGQFVLINCVIAMWF